MKKKIFILYLLIIGSSAAVFAQEVSARIVSLGGSAEIHSGRSITNESAIDVGFIVREADLVSTGSDGYVELEITSPSNIVFVKINRNSAFYFMRKQADAIFLRILSGDAEIRITEAFLDDKVNVSLGKMLLYGGREFGVTLAPEGSVLLTCTEGSVLCRTVLGRQYYIEAGMTLEFLPNRSPRSNEIGSENFPRFRNDWFAERVRLFRLGAFSITRQRIDRYEESAKQFTLFYNELVKFESIFEKYKNGTEGIARSTILGDKAKIESAISDMKSIFFRHEELFYSVVESKNLHNQFPIRGALRRRYTIADFMGDFERNYEQMVKKASHTRQMLKIYSKMSDNNFSTALIEEIFNVNPVF
ncbi:MAG: hypothetical protein FWC36_08895 [Spirochaetes bacterium]|nr:hypothetical protein [Spirochaetota bacterium]